MPGGRIYDRPPCKSYGPEAKKSRLALAVPNPGPHAPFLAAELSPALSGFFDPHNIPRPNSDRKMDSWESEAPAKAATSVGVSPPTSGLGETLPTQDGDNLHTVTNEYTRWT